jgi:hypothetical protein
LFGVESPPFWAGVDVGVVDDESTVFAYQFSSPVVLYQSGGVAFRALFYFIYLNFLIT